MKKFLVLFLVWLSAGVSLFAQTTPPPYVPTVIPPSPNASTLMKFADVPVSPYTGASDITVPIYTIQAKGLSIPVELAYHTGGIRLGEEAGLVGLGWSLVADATISRTVHDKDDFLNPYYGPTAKGDLGDLQYANSSGNNFNVNKYVFCFACSQSVNFASGVSNDLSNLFSAPNTGDAELDTYSYNIFGKSGKFFITPTGIVVMQKQENIKIQLIHTGGINYVFQVTDDSGNNYYFYQTEYYYPHTGTPQVSSWHVSTVVTQQKDSVRFTYAVPNAITVAQDKHESYRAGCQVHGWSYSSDGSTSYDNVNLQTIDYKDGQVKFYYGNLFRQDLQSANKLDSIQIYSKTTAGLKYLKSHKLYYDYFAPFGAASDSLELKRLRLDSVKEFSGGTALRPYQFTYTNINGPYLDKHSFAIDHWGYYNGAGNTTFIPTYLAELDPTFDLGAPGIEYYSFTGANRETDTSRKCLYL